MPVERVDLSVENARFIAAKRLKPYALNTARAAPPSWQALIKALEIV